jgi:AraC family transcriptional regulator, transcriptional activator of pobA
MNSHHFSTDMNLKTKCDFADKTDCRNRSFEVLEIENDNFKDKYDFDAHRHPHFEIIWITKGTVTLNADFFTQEIDDNYICCIKPGQIHRLNVNGGAKGYIYSFPIDFLLISNDASINEFSRINSFLSSPTMVTRISRDVLAEVREVGLMIVNEFKNYSVMRTDLLRGLLKVFLIYLAREYRNPDILNDQSRSFELGEKFFDLLDKKFITAKMVKDYAFEIAVTPSYLNQAIRKISGFPASYHIKQRVMLEAKRHAIFSRYTMKEIAYKLGFEDPSHFSKFFKNACGDSFTDFRRTVKDQNIISETAVVTPFAA